MSRYQHLIGRPFDYSKQDCYDLLRDFYKDVFDIEIPNYARPKNWWNEGLNLYADLASKIGFYSLDCHPSQYQFGDVVMCAVDSPVANHVGIIVEKGEILHHLWGRLSAVEHYRLLLRNTTVGVYRHRDVKLEQIETPVNLIDLVPSHIRRKYDDYLRSSQDV